MKRYYGYRPNLPDHRDHKYSFSGNPATVPAQFYDLAKFDPNAFDQENIGSCLPNASIGAAKNWMLQTNYKYAYVPSRLKLYYDARVLDGTVDQDAGTTPRSVFQAFNQQGVCPEDESSNWNWAYDTSKFTVKPPEQCYKDAQLHRCLTYAVVNQDQLSVASALANKINLVIGINVFSQIESEQCDENGIIQMPGFFDAPIGGHGLHVSGYNEQYVFGPNSWSNKWGGVVNNRRGYFFLPWKYLLDSDLCSYIGTVELIT